MYLGLSAAFIYASSALAYSETTPLSLASSVASVIPNAAALASSNSPVLSVICVILPALSSEPSTLYDIKLSPSLLIKLSASVR